MNFAPLHIRAGEDRNALVQHGVYCENLNEGPIGGGAAEELNQLSTHEVDDSGCVEK